MSTQSKKFVKLEQFNKQNQRFRCEVNFKPLEHYLNKAQLKPQISTLSVATSFDLVADLVFHGHCDWDVIDKICCRFRLGKSSLSMALLLVAQQTVAKGFGGGLIFWVLFKLKSWLSRIRLAFSKNVVCDKKSHVCLFINLKKFHVMYIYCD